MLFRLLAALAVAASLAPAHVGVREVYFDGLAGPYPLNIVIVPPRVIPGVAEIYIKAEAGDLRQLRVTPMTLTGAGSKYPPTPESAVPDSKTPNFWRSSVWIMTPGSWQVRVLASGDRGEGALSVPIAAASDKVAEMDPTIGRILAVLISLLVIGAVGIVGAAVSEAALPPGATPLSGRRLWLIRGVSLAAASAVLWLGWQWWDAEAKAYAASLYKPLAMDVEQAGSKLTIRLRHTGWYQNKKLDGFLEEHGHRMHLFGISETQPRALLHLHPVAIVANEFAFQLPQVPAAPYRFFADIVHPNGFAETVSARATLKATNSTPASQPPDDSALLFPVSTFANRDFTLANGWKVEFKPDFNSLQTGQTRSTGELSQPLRLGTGHLRFRVLDRDANTVKNLRPYLGMAAHLIVFRQDFRIFAHLHPAGTPSMSAVNLGMATLGLSLAPNESGHYSMANPDGAFDFPFGFTETGNYTAVLQFRDSQKIFSAHFDFSIR
jgi:hypothetical protein